MSCTGEDALTLPTTPASPCVIEFDEQINVRMGNIVCSSDGTIFFTLNRREYEVQRCDAIARAQIMDTAKQWRPLMLR